MPNHRTDPHKIHRGVGDDDGQDGRGERVAGVPNHSESASEEFCGFTIDFRTTAPAPV